MSDYQKQTEFLKACLRYHDTAGNRKLADRITQIQQNEWRVQRALKVMGGLAAVAAVGLGYSAIFLDYFPRNFLGFSAHLLAQTFCVMGLVAIVCLLVFACLASVHREQLNQGREECRQLISNLLESRPGQPIAAPQAPRNHGKNGMNAPGSSGRKESTSANQKSIELQQKERYMNRPSCPQCGAKLGNFLYPVACPLPRDTTA